MSHDFPLRPAPSPFNFYSDRQTSSKPLPFSPPQQSIDEPISFSGSRASPLQRRTLVTASLPILSWPQDFDEPTPTLPSRINGSSGSEPPLTARARDFSRPSSNSDRPSGLDSDHQNSLDSAQSKPPSLHHTWPRLHPLHRRSP